MISCNKGEIEYFGEKSELMADLACIVKVLMDHNGVTIDDVLAAITLMLHIDAEVENG